jgi:hypothetical protein
MTPHAALYMYVQRCVPATLGWALQTLQPDGQRASCVIHDKVSALRRDRGRQRGRRPWVYLRGPRGLQVMHLVGGRSSTFTFHAGLCLSTAQAASLLCLSHLSPVIVILLFTYPCHFSRLHHRRIFPSAQQTSTPELSAKASATRAAVGLIRDFRRRGDPLSGRHRFCSCRAAVGLLGLLGLLLLLRLYQE